MMTPSRKQLQQQQQHNGTKSWNVSSVYSLISHSLVAFMSFQVGMLSNFNSLQGVRCGRSLQQPAAKAAANNFSCAECICPMCPEKESPAKVAEAAAKQSSTAADSIFPKNAIGQVIAGAALVDRRNFMRSFDIGVPWDIPWAPGNNQILMLYGHNSSLPSSGAQAPSSSSALPVFMSPTDATKNCNSLKVVLTPTDEANQCLAIVGQWESYHVHKYMRLPKDNNDESAVSPQHALRYTARHPPSLSRLPVEDTLIKGNYGKILTEYIAKVPETLTRLAPLAAKAAGNDKTIIVMICNFGQSQVLFNFVCSARARKLDLSKILLFATDQETVDLATNLGLLVFDVQDAFGEMPKQAANQYRDQTFAGMMLGKIYCVHLINMLGYDLLFQDVDVFWYKNPIDDFFKNIIALAGDFDLYFQDDGSRNAFYGPYSACSGFYFVRHNTRTEYLFSMFARIGDQVIAGGSHQTVFTSLILEHVSWRGLRVKVFANHDVVIGEKLPSGYHYQTRRNFMIDLIQGKKDPYIFHMHWTKNKDDKRNFYQQMSEWFLKDECTDQNVSSIDNWSPEKPNSLIERCCYAQPNFQCHYRDKPSTKPCRDSPTYDVKEMGNNNSFW